MREFAFIHRNPLCSLASIIDHASIHFRHCRSPAGPKDHYICVSQRDSRATAQFTSPDAITQNKGTSSVVPLLVRSEVLKRRERKVSIMPQRFSKQQVQPANEKTTEKIGIKKLERGPEIEIVEVQNHSFVHRKSKVRSRKSKIRELSNEVGHCRGS